MKYRIRILKNGECDVRNYITYTNGNEETSLFYMYVCVIEAAKSLYWWIPALRIWRALTGSVKIHPRRSTPKAGRADTRTAYPAGIDPADISHVFITHLHGDHYDYFDLFPMPRWWLMKKDF